MNERYVWGNTAPPHDLQDVYQRFLWENISGSWSFVMFDTVEFSTWLAYGFVLAQGATYLPFEYQGMKVHVVCYRTYGQQGNHFAEIRQDIIQGKIRM